MSINITRCVKQNWWSVSSFLSFLSISLNVSLALMGSKLPSSTHRATFYTYSQCMRIQIELVLELGLFSANIMCVPKLITTPQIIAGGGGWEGTAMSIPMTGFLGISGSNEIHERCPTKSSLKHNMVPSLSGKTQKVCYHSQHKCKITYQLQCTRTYWSLDSTTSCPLPSNHFSKPLLNSSLATRKRTLNCCHYTNSYDS